jgi:hypothetical protein
LTYDHVLLRAKRILNTDTISGDEQSVDEWPCDDEIPF